MTKSILFALLAASLVLPAELHAQESAATQAVLFDSEGYRIGRYRAPVDRDVSPAKRITIADALALEAGKNALFLDVMPTEGALRDPVTGTWRLSVVHETIPGSQWHPETGRSPPDVVLWTALERAVKSARSDRADLPVVIYCRSDCWMSWNAARRLALKGYHNILWLAEGTDGWHAAGRPLDTATPVAVPHEPCSEGK